MAGNRIDYFAFLTDQKRLYDLYADDIVHTGGTVEQIESLLFEESDRETAEHVLSDIVFMLDELSPRRRENMLFTLYLTSRLQYVRLWKHYLETGEYHNPAEVVDKVFATFRDLCQSYEATDALPPALQRVVRMTMEAVERFSQEFLERIVEREITQLAAEEETKGGAE